MTSTRHLTPGSRVLRGAFLGLLASALPAQEPVLEGRHGGEGFSRPCEAFDDSVPLPIPALTRAADGGDELVAPASGDPFFLGFATGSYYPPEGQRIDPAFAELAARGSDDGRPRDDVYGFVMFQRRMTRERFAELESIGVRLLEFHPHYCMKAAIPLAQLHVAARHPAVRWIGTARQWQKLHPMLSRQLAVARPGDVHDVLITVFESDLNPASSWTAAGGGLVHELDPGGRVNTRVLADPQARTWMSHGWQQRALQKRGVVVDEYIPRIECFRARITRDVLPRILGLDFVQFVEAERPVSPQHDESVPMINADNARGSYDGGTSTTAIAGIIDSGIEIAHEMLDHFYGAGFTTIPSPDPWIDPCGHGSHVAGTLLGAPPAAVEGYRGMAPGLGGARTLRVRNVRVAPGTSYGSCGTVFGTSLTTGYYHMRGNFTDLLGNVSGPPHVVNCSWGGIGPIIGTEGDARAIDGNIWDYEQFYCFAAGNHGPGAGTVGLPAGAKNSFAVGAVLDHHEPGLGDPGTLANLSSRGPCADGRWKPNVVAPGRWIRSADSRTTTDYVDKQGTSLSAPHVTGLAAQLCDHYSAMRYSPHGLAALLMATAHSKGDVQLTSPTDSHLDEYGAGLIDAEQSHFDEVDWTRTTHTFLEGAASGWMWHYHDFTVAANTTRLVVCMSYHEDSASSGASQALVNDLELWLDRDPIDPGGNTGEYWAQQSTVDNTEIRYIDNPTPGPWRWKVYPATALPGEAVRVGVTVLQITSDHSPTMGLAVTANEEFVQPDEHVEITATLTPSDYIATSVFLDSTVSPAATLHSASTTHRDGVVTELLGNQHAGLDVSLGAIEDDAPRSITWEASWSAEGIKVWAVEARADNAATVNGVQQIFVDGTEPGLPTNLHSTTHSTSTWSNDPSITYSWTAGTDNLSGVEGYWVSTSPTTPSAPTNIRVIGALTSLSDTLGDGDGWYFNMRTVDRSGNTTSGFISTGPYPIDTAEPGLPASLRSTSHTVGAWSNDPDVVLAWTAATDGRSGLDGYGEAQGSRSPLSVAPTKVLEETATSRTMRLASSATGWYYALRSVDNAGNWSRGTAEIGPFKIDTVDPGAVTRLSSSSHTVGQWSNTPAIDVDWTAASDAHSGLAGYCSLWDSSATTVPSGALDVPASATSLRHTLSSASRGWYLHLRAQDRAGNWGPTAHLGPFPIDTAGPAGPSGLASSTHTPGVWSAIASIDMRWSAASDPESGLAGYAAVWDSAPATDPSGALNVSAAATSFRATLNAGASWYFHLRARDAAGNWGATAHLGPFQIDTAGPAGPTGLGSTTHTPAVWSGIASIDMRWGTASDPGSGLAGYVAVWDSAPATDPTGALNVSAAATSFTASLGAGASWYFHVRARDRVGNWGSTAHLGPFQIDTGAPTGPTGLASSTHTPGVWSALANIDVRWSPASDPGSGLAGYAAVWDSAAATDPTGALNVTASATTLSHGLSSASHGWYLHLRAQDRVGNWGRTAHLGPFQIDTRGPAGPTGLAAAAHTPGMWSALANIDMRWSAASDPESGLAGYAAVWDSSAATDPTRAPNIASSATAHSATLSTGSSWYFHLRARDAAGNWGSTAHAGPYWIDVQPPTARLEIDSGNPATASLGVSLAITAADPHSGLDRMRFRNDGGTWSPWVAFAASKAWRLSDHGGSSATGTRSVEVEVVDRAGNRRMASDAIYHYVAPISFGSSCAGSRGLPVFSIDGVPGLGHTVTFATANSAASAQLIYLGLSRTTWLGLPLPLDLAILGAPGCALNVSLDIPFFTGPQVPLPIPIPVDPSVAGGTLYFQNLLFFDPSGQLVVTSNGVEVMIGGI